MAYSYQTTKERLFTDQGQRTFLKVRDYINKIIAASGAIRMQEVFHSAGGDSDVLMACVDRMVELGELYEIKYEHPSAQYRVFMAK